MKKGQVQFQSFQRAGAGPGTKVQNFGASEFAQDEILFDVDQAGGVATGTCTATQLCVTVQLTNHTGRKLDDLFTEVTGYQDIVPPTETISWAGSPFTYSQAYASVFANPAHVEAAFYGDLDLEQTKPAEWKFNVGMAQDFTFDIGVLASVRRSDYVMSTQANAPVVDACALAGHAQYLTSTDDAETDIALPFPYTLYDKTYDRAVLGSNGYALFNRTGDTAPSLGTGATNSSLISGAPPGLYPFWDDLAFDADGGVCVATTGTVPNRTLTITWKNAKINAAQPSKGTWAPSRVTNSLILSENSDQIAFEYLLPDAGITNLTRGSSATIGQVGIVNGLQTGMDFSSNALSSIVPANSGGYPFRFARSPDTGVVQSFTPSDVDIGGPGIAGSAAASLGVFTVNGSGGQINGLFDQFNFAYQQVSGDCSIVARLTSLTNTSPFAQAGVMIRNDFTPQSAMAQTKLFVSGGAWFLHRANNQFGGGQLTSPGLFLNQRPWLKVTRRGSTFTGYARADDSPTWVQIGSPATIPMNTTVYVGLDVCSHDNTKLGTGTLDNVVISIP